MYTEFEESTAAAGAENTGLERSTTADGADKGLEVVEEEGLPLLTESRLD